MASNVNSSARDGNSLQLPELSGEGDADTDSRFVDELLLQAQSDQQPSLSVVMPTLDEQEGIAECIERIKTAIEELGITAEIIVSDSSTDRTPEIARDLGAIVVEPDEQGYGYAYRYGFEHARGEYIVMGDADTTYDFEEIPSLIRRLLETDSDIVLGSRLEGDIKPGAMPNLHQYVGNPLLTKFLNVFYRAGVSDAHSGFRVFTRETLDRLELQTDGMEFASEMIMDASVKDLDIEEVPITYHEREGEATLDSFRDGWRHVKFMLQNAPGYLFSVPGAALATVGVSVMVLSLLSVEVTGLAVGTVSFGSRSMVAGSLLTIVGAQVASLGVFSTLTSDPIRRPDDRLTEWIAENLTLKTGGIVGLVLFAAGSAYATYLLYRWLMVGYEVPTLAHDALAFTLIILGVQAVFSSFFMSTIAE